MNPESAVPVPPRARAHIFLRYWLPVLLWMAVIFGFSTGAGSSSQTSRFLRPLLHWMFPAITDDTAGRVIYTLRKGGHVAEYSLLALLLWRARRGPGSGSARPWNWREAGFALGGAALFAVSDEIHQAFVPLRQGQAADVLLNSAGAAAALLAWRTLGRWRGKW